MLNLCLPEFLRAGASAGRRSGSEKSCIFIIQQGGASQLDTWDLKPQASDTIRSPFKPIASRVPGIQVCELLPQLARLSDRYSLIRSMTTLTSTHGACLHMCLSGRSMPISDRPHFGSILAKVRPSTRNIPSYVWLQRLEENGNAPANYLTGGSLGQTYAPLLIGARLDNPSSPGFRVNGVVSVANGTGAGVGTASGAAAAAASVAAGATCSLLTKALPYRAEGKGKEDD